MSQRISPVTTIAISLKMYLGLDATNDWCAHIGHLARTHRATTSGAAEIVVFPSTLSIPSVLPLLSGCKVGAQDIFHEDGGGFTGGVSPRDIRALGCSYAELGHAERSTFFHETAADTRLKLQAAWRNGLIGLLCVGEIDRTTPMDAAQVCIGQIRSAIENVGIPGKLMVAYEPVWAIGKGSPAPVDWVAEVIDQIRAWLRQWGRPDDPVVYGGSAGEGLLTQLRHTVDGLFLGRFAHDPEAVRRILDEV